MLVLSSLNLCDEYRGTNFLTSSISTIRLLPMGILLTTNNKI